MCMFCFVLFLNTHTCSLEQLSYSHCPISPHHIHQSSLHNTHVHTLSPLLQCTMDSDKVSKIVAENDQAVFTAIWEGVERANECATSQQYWVCIPLNVQGCLHY